MQPEAVLAQTSEGGVRTSAVLLRAIRGDGDRITIGQILDALDARAFGLACLIFSLPSIIPMPPGVPTIVGIALFIVSLQMVLGRQELWLPGFVSRKSFSRPALVTSFEKALRRVEVVEKIARPRLLFMTGGPGTVFIGLVVLFMALILILPLPPGGNFPPALACAVLGLGLAERDGLIVIVGMVAAALATAAVTLVTVGFVALLLPEVMAWITRIFGG